MMTIDTRPYEANGKRVTVSGWACDQCKVFYGDLPHSEHMAKWCCSTSQPCNTDGCEGRAEKPWTACEACRQTKADKKYADAKRVEWDGETPLCTFDGDRYFFGAESVMDWLDSLDDDERADPRVLRFEVCEEMRPPHFSMYEYLQDVLAEDDDGGTLDSGDVDKAVNDWLKKHAPFSWTGSGEVPSPESFAKHVEMPEGWPTANA